MFDVKKVFLRNFEPWSMVIEGVAFGKVTKMRQKKCFYLQFATLSQPKLGMCLFTLVIRKNAHNWRKNFTLTFFITESPWIAMYIYPGWGTRSLFQKSERKALQEKSQNPHNHTPEIVVFPSSSLSYQPKKIPHFSLKFFVLSNWKYPHNFFHY
jgi:hypothetical protein